MKAFLVIVSCLVFVAAAQEFNIVDTARRMGIYSYLLALQETDSLDLVAKTQNITVFMPTNQAFMTVDSAERNRWRSDPVYYQNMMRYHVVKGALNSSALVDENSYMTFFDRWTARFVNYKGFSADVQVYEASKISTFDIKASNGIIHFIDQVVTEVQNETIMQVLEGRSDTNTIVEAIKMVDNVSLALNGSAMPPATVSFLAPSDVAFGKLAPGAWSNITKNPAQLKEILQYWVLSQGTWYSRGLTKNLQLRTYNSVSNVTVHYPNNELSFDNAKATSWDLAAVNGVAYVVDTVFFPPALQHLL